MERRKLGLRRRIIVGFHVAAVAATLLVTSGASPATASNARGIGSLWSDSVGPTQTQAGSIAAQGRENILGNPLDSTQDAWSGSELMQADISFGLPARLAHGYDSMGQPPPFLGEAGPGGSTARQDSDRSAGSAVDRNQIPDGASLQEEMKNRIGDGLPPELAHGYNSIG